MSDDNERFGLDGLIEALTILAKYGNPEWPTQCAHDELHVMINPDLVSAEDIDRLDSEFGFIPSSYGTSFVSFRFGSA